MVKVLSSFNNQTVLINTNKSYKIVSAQKMTNKNKYEKNTFI